MILRNIVTTAFLVLLAFASAAAAGAETGAKKVNIPDGFVYAEETIPDLVLEMRYGGRHNFVGERIDGYVKDKCILTREAAQALKKVQEELKPFGLGIKVFDCYRPQMAVDRFVRWAADLSDTRMKAEFYPDVDKKNLFSDGYIAAKSSHSRGSTVDLTIVSLKKGEGNAELDMGSGFDFFGPRSWPDYLNVGSGQRAHRMLLQKVMTDNGFQPYAQEWWHFTLRGEPFPQTYFNFPVE